MEEGDRFRKSRHDLFLRFLPVITGQRLEFVLLEKVVIHTSGIPKKKRRLCKIVRLFHYVSRRLLPNKGNKNKQTKEG